MKKARKIYLSGPMKGYHESNYPAFAEAAAKLRADGHEVYSPHECIPPGQPSIEALRAAFASYCRYICEEACTVVLLPGWQHSKGVSAEKALAENCGLDVLEFETLNTTPETVGAA